MSMPNRSDQTYAARHASVPAPAAAPGTVTSTGARIVFVESPARLLIEELSHRLDPAPTIGDNRWPGAARLVFIVGATLMLWTLIGFAALSV